LGSQVLSIRHQAAQSPASRVFLARVAPRVVIVSSEGRTGEARSTPASQLTQILDNSGPRIFRTDTDGATTVEWDGRRLLVRTYRNPEGTTLIFIK